MIDVKKSIIYTETGGINYTNLTIKGSLSVNYSHVIGYEELKYSRLNIRNSVKDTIVKEIHNSIYGDIKEHIYKIRQIAFMPDYEMATALKEILDKLDNLLRI